MPGFEEEKIGEVYFILAKKCDLVKVGFSIQLKKRLRALRVSSPDELQLLTTLPEVPILVEKIIHRGLAEDRSHGEWFRRSDKLNSMITYIEQHRESMFGEDLFEEMYAKRII